MEKRRKIQILSIVALMFAIVGMSVGFAAFSATLNISSSATVTPSSGDLKIKIYGFESIDNLNAFEDSFRDYGIFSEQYVSQTKGVAYAPDPDVITEDAIIDNSSMSIRNMNVSFKQSVFPVAAYFFILRNEGEHTTYFDWKNFMEKYYNNGNNGFINCEILGESYSDDTANAIDNLQLDFAVLDKNGEEVDFQSVSFVPDEFICFVIRWKYDGPSVDAPVSCSVNNVQFTFTSVPVNE